MLQSSSFEKKKKKVKPLIIAHFGPNLNKKWVRMQGCWGVGGSPPTSQKFVHPPSPTPHPTHTPNFYFP